MKRALAPLGVIATQGECLWLHLPLITTVLRACAEMFGSVDYAFTTVPSYPSGQIGFVLASVEERGEFERISKRSLRFWWASEWMGQISRMLPTPIIDLPGSHGPKILGTKHRFHPIL